MKEMIKVRKQDNKNVVNARELHAFLEVKTLFRFWIKNRIDKYDFTEGVDFIGYDKKISHANNRVYTSKEFALTLDMAKELSMVENNDQGRKARQYFIKAEKELQLAKENELLKLKERQESRLEHPAMTKAIMERKELEGKEPKSYHFSNEANLINNVVLGCSAAKWRKLHELDKKESLRDDLTVVQITAVNHMQKVNTALIETGFSYEDRKERLNALYQSKYHKAIVDEFNKLNG